MLAAAAQSAEVAGGKLFWQIVLLFLLILCNAFFAASEIAIISLNDAKLHKMAEEGLLEEVQALLAMGLPRNATAMQAIGYKEAVAAVQGKAAPQDAVAAIQLASRRYAKRQMTWFRANPAVQWLDASAGADEIFRAALQKAADFDSGI